MRRTAAPLPLSHQFNESAHDRKRDVRLDAHDGRNRTASGCFLR